MFGIGTTELLLIVVVALIVLGPRKLPEIATKIGRIVGSIRRMSTQFQRTLNAEVAELEAQEMQKKQQENREKLEQRIKRESANNTIQSPEVAQKQWEQYSSYASPYDVANEFCMNNVPENEGEREHNTTENTVCVAMQEQQLAINSEAKIPTEADKE